MILKYTSFLGLFNLVGAISDIGLFLKGDQYHHLIVCKLWNDENYQEIVEVFNNHQVFVQTMNFSSCNIEINRALIILNEPEPSEFLELLNHQGVQKSLKSNTWIIHTKNKTRSATDFIKNNQFRIGLNAKLFVSINDVGLVQMLGIGTISPEIKVEYDILFFLLRG